MNESVFENIPKLSIIYYNISELKVNPHNARRHSEKQISKIARSINEFGIIPIVTDENKIILAGHAVVKAAESLGIAEIPTVVLTHLNKTQKRAFMLTLNKLSEQGEWDRESLKIEFEFLIEENFDMSITGFETPELDIVLNTDFFNKEKAEKPDKADQLPDKNKIQSIIKKGDLYRIGYHYLLCGDSRDGKSFEILLGDKKANMILTDSPFNCKVSNIVGLGKIKHEEFAMASGEMSPEEFTNFLETIFSNLAKYSTDGSLHFHYMDWRNILEIMTAGKSVYTELKNLCIWDKGRGGMGSLYRSQHELCFLFKNGTASHCNNIELGKHGRYRTNVWNYPGISVTNPGSLEDLKLHPTVKPVAMLADAILDCSRPGDIILDCFAGSGSTLLAAERTKRRAYCIEYDPHYCDVIIHRYKSLFNGKVVEFIGNFGGTING